MNSLEFFVVWGRPQAMLTLPEQEKIRGGMCVVSDFPLFQTQKLCRYCACADTVASVFFVLILFTPWFCIYLVLPRNSGKQNWILVAKESHIFSVKCPYENIFMTNWKECKIRLKLLKQNSPNSINVRWGGIAPSKENLHIAHCALQDNSTLHYGRPEQHKVRDRATVGPR